MTLQKFAVAVLSPPGPGPALNITYVLHLPEKDVDQDDDVEYQINDRKRTILHINT